MKNSINEEYLTLDYDSFIQSIIDERGQWNEEVLNSSQGCEKHHIIPACLGGDGDFISPNGRSSFRKKSHHPNCIYLYPSEHFIAHQLLYKKYPDNYGLYAAVIGTTKNYLIDVDDYADLKQFNHTLPKELLDKLDSNGKHHYKKRKTRIRKTNIDTSKYVEEQARRRLLGIQGNPGESNGMFGKGDKVSGGKNGHASIRYFYKNLVFESRKELVEYLQENNIKIIKSAILRLINGKLTRRGYLMYQEVFDNLDWEYKN